jgi:hypothetical protein
MTKPTFLKAGAAALVVAGGVLGAIFALVPAASADERSPNEHSLVRPADANGRYSFDCYNTVEDRRDNGPDPDYWEADCEVHYGVVHAETVCERRNGSRYINYGGDVGRGYWHVGGACDYSGGGRYDSLVDYYLTGS